MKAKIIIPVIAFLCGCLFGRLWPNAPEEPSYVIDTIPAWDVFTDALIRTESNGNPNAIGKTGDVGILQITPIYVADVNRIAHTHYTLEDRYDPDKSLEMFNIMNAYYNPDFNIDKAIALHNPNAGAWYGDRIKKYMVESLNTYAPGQEYNGTPILMSALQSDYSIIIIR